ncbi:MULTISPECIES: PD-(D/E)XK nuclease family protein [Clostridium]|uniref:PD-(D/E)XK nuclease family protein n=1 Tax=Clostridium TaxID=1485 RepID=UPI00082530B1|nr:MULTISPECIES: PD-(D/E)XK nuclease family protein [Clostridium]
MLNAKLNIFNPFKVLKIDTFEIRNSNVISWLLSPNGNHGLEDKVLKKVLSEIILKSENVDIKKSAMETSFFPKITFYLTLNISLIKN